MLKLVNKLDARDEKVVEKVALDENSQYIYMTFNEGDFLPFVIPLRPQNECVERASCDRFR